MAHIVNKIDHANHLLLEMPLLYLPYELIQTNFRSAHWHIEKDSTSVKNLLKETATSSLNQRATPDDVLKNLDAMIAKMRGLKRKLSSHADEEARLFRQVGARVEHLADLAEMHTLDDVRYETWSRQRLDRLLVDYMLRHGHNDSAMALAEHRGIEDLVDVETFVQVGKIQQDLRNHSVKEALDWCMANKKELRKHKSNLEFELRYQQFFQLIRNEKDGQPVEINKLVEGVAFAKKHLYPFREAFPREVNQAALMLALEPQIDPEGHHKELWLQERWDTLVELFTKTHHEMHLLPRFPLLHIALQPGLSALKTPACHSTYQSSSAAPSHLTSLTSSVCPICSTELNDLARNVPYAHHSQSHVDNDLVLLPNMRVYGREKLQDYANKAGLPPNQVKDLRTGETYTVGELKKVFIT